jgi:hypothetical protein
VSTVAQLRSTPWEPCFTDDGHDVNAARRALRRGVASVVVVPLLVATAILCQAPFSSDAAAVRKVLTCFHNQLEVAVAWALLPAAGSNGVPFIIANTGTSACSIEGYPKLDFVNGTYKKRSVRVTDGGGGLFATVRPRLIVIQPGGTASFGLGFGDAANQQDPSGAACTTQNIYVTLPVRVSEIPQNYETTVDINFCFSDFEFSVTAFEPGALPKQR